MTAMAAYRKSINHDYYKNLMRELNEGKLRPVYLFYGEEDFLLENSWHTLRRLCLNEATADIDGLSYKLDGNGSRLDLRKLGMELRTPPFLSDKRLILIQRSGFFATKGSLGDDDFEILSKSIGEMADTTVLVFWEEKIDGRQKRIQKLIDDAGGLIVQFPRQDPETLNNWVRAWLRREGLEIEALACESLVDRCEMDMRSLTQELSKLKLACKYDKRTRIDLTLVNKLCRPDNRGSIFDLTDALSLGDSSEALRLLHLLWANKEPSQVILIMLARHFKQLLCAHEWSQSELAKGLPVAPFVAKRLKEQSRHFTPEMLEALYEACFQTDWGIKTGKFDDETGLEILLAQAGRAARSVKLRRR